VYELDTSTNRPTENVLYDFAGGADGAFPNGDLVMDASGNLYGTTNLGGGSGLGEGTVFKLVNSMGSYSESLLHNFTLSDGADPFGGLVLDESGNLYGTTCGSDGGTVFKLNTSGNNFDILHNFAGHNSDGQCPIAGLLLDPSGHLYGTTLLAGPVTDGDYGTAFELDPSGQNFHVLHDFNSLVGDGTYPQAALINDSSGNLYGTTHDGGASNDGIVFELTPSSASATGYTESILHSFSGPDGAHLSGGLVMDSAGNLFRTTVLGGSLSTDCTTDCATGNGTVFELDKAGGFHVLHYFSYTDGAFPNGDLVLDAAGNLYVITVRGGDNDAGTAFKLATADTSQQELSNMVDYVNALSLQGTINNGQDNSLLKELQKSTDMSSKGKTNGAIGNLESFIGEVNDMSSSGILSPAQAGALVSAANSVIAQLQTN
jgi:uncharacterized repeat protein (TIGR03803 family)